ncbi:MAG: type I-C CRISPR-associated protein Cas8c/Csd1 [Schwartzia sp.]|nr:type I-C CRISPR-associated protein Cas8c/Csd1 [Schwartzia sp. (in: firmicutes)]
MILEALYRHYEDLQRRGKVSRKGWMPAKVSAALKLDMQGNLVGFMPLMRTVKRGKKDVLVPSEMNVPEFGTRSGKAPKAQYLCDNAKFFLGLDEKSEAGINKAYFARAKERHLKELAGCSSAAGKAVCSFFEHWQPEAAQSNEIVQEYREEILAASNLVFWVNDDYAQNDEEIIRLWDGSCTQTANESMGLCLVTGEHAPIARLHKAFHGVRGAQSSGAMLVSFNADSFESYGKDKAQGLNAHVSEKAAFAYGEALSYLLNDDRHQKYIGDMTVVYWAEKQNEACQDIFSDFGFEDGNEMTQQDLNAILQAVKEGKTIVYNGQEIPYDNDFYILGLSPNAARISVRFFYRSSFGKILLNIQQHHERMEIVRPSGKEWAPIPLWRFLLATVSPTKSKNQVASPPMTGAVFRSILMNSLYPASLYQNVMIRIKAEQDDTDSTPPHYKITDVRAAIIKAYLIKNKGRQITVALNENCEDTAYVLGRIFSVWEQIQEAANPGLNSTIKDRYFNAACATPTAVFSKLQILSNHHLRKLEKGQEVYYEKKLTELMSKLNGGEALPKTLSLDEQGMFILGYYHQTQKRYEKKEDK